METPSFLAWWIMQDLQKANQRLSTPYASMNLESTLRNIEEFVDLVDESLWKSICEVDNEMRQVGLFGWPVQCWSSLIAFHGEFAGMIDKEAQGDAAPNELAARKVKRLQDLVKEPSRIEPQVRMQERLYMLFLELDTVLNAPVPPKHHPADPRTNRFHHGGGNINEGEWLKTPVTFEILKDCAGSKNRLSTMNRYDPGLIQLTRENWICRVDTQPLKTRQKLKAAEAEALNAIAATDAKAKKMTAT